MLIRIFESPACILNLSLLLLKNGHVRSFFNVRTKPFVSNVDPLFLILILLLIITPRIRLRMCLIHTEYFTGKGCCTSFNQLKTVRDLLK